MSFKNALNIRNLQQRIFHPGSKPERLLRLINKGLKFWKTQGFIAFIKTLYLWITFRILYPSNSYKKWITKNEPGEIELLEQRNICNQFSYRPLISIIIPVYNPPIDVLRAAIDSVLHQSYPNWELCIANGSSDEIPLTQMLKDYSEQDKRIHLVNLEKNLGIAGNTNAAISLANGEYVAFLDHDDCLAPFALFEVVSAMNKYPKTDILYSDEDKLSPDGKNRYDAYFKSAFNLELLRGNNYMCHFLVIRKSIGDLIGWDHDGFEGAQDFDLVLRAIEKSEWVTHIPKVLYHWRTIEGSTASNPGAKTYTTDSGIRALREHLTRLGITAKVQQARNPTNYRINYSILGNPKVSIIIPSHDHADDLRRCIKSIFEKTTYSNYEIVIIENNSHEEKTSRLYDELRTNSMVKIIEYQQPFNYSTINNFAVKSTSGELILLLNNDVEVINPDWLDQMLEYAVQPEVGAVGAKLYYPDGTLQHGGVILAPGGVAGHSDKKAPPDSTGYFNRLILPQNFSAVTAACLMVRKEVFNEVVGFDEKYQLAFGDVDFCLKLREKGYLIVWTPYAELVHYESQTRGVEDTPKKQARFKKEVAYFREKWLPVLEKGDPYYNPNLLAAGNFNFKIAGKSGDMSPRSLPIQLPRRSEIEQNLSNGNKLSQIG